MSFLKNCQICQVVFYMNIFLAHTFSNKLIYFCLFIWVLSTRLGAYGKISSLPHTFIMHSCE